MAKINLLPWRAERRKLREREFYMTLAAAAVAGLLAVLLWAWWMGARLDNQDERNAYMTNQIKLLDSKLTEIKKLEETKSKLLARKQIIEQLQASRAQMVHLFDELVKTIPDSVRLNLLKQAGDTLTLEGMAQSNASVASYMRNLDNSPCLSRSDLQQTEIKGDDKRDRFQFGLTVKLGKPPEDKSKSEQGGASAPGGAGAALGKTADAGSDKVVDAGCGGATAATSLSAAPVAPQSPPPKNTPASSGGKP